MVIVNMMLNCIMVNMYHLNIIYDLAPHYTQMACCGATLCQDKYYGIIIVVEKPYPSGISCSDCNDPIPKWYETCVDGTR